LGVTCRSFTPRSSVRSDKGNEIFSSALQRFGTYAMNAISVAVGFCAEAHDKVSALSLQFRNRRAAGKNQVGPPGKIGNGDLPGVNAEVAVNRRQKIAGRAHP